MRRILLQGQQFDLPKPQGRLKQSESTAVTVGGSIQVLAGGAVNNLNGNFGAFQLPKNALLKKVVIITNKTAIATGLITPIDAFFNLGGTPGLFYKPPVSALTSLFDLTLFKTSIEGQIDTSFNDDPIFIPANTSLNPSITGYGSFVLNDQLNGTMYLFFTML